MKRQLCPSEVNEMRSLLQWPHLSIWTSSQTFERIRELERAGRLMFEALTGERLKVGEVADGAALPLFDGPEEEEAGLLFDDDL